MFLEKFIVVAERFSLSDVNRQFAVNFGTHERTREPASAHAPLHVIDISESILANLEASFAFQSW